MFFLEIIDFHRLHKGFYTVEDFASSTVTIIIVIMKNTIFKNSFIFNLIKQLTIYLATSGSKVRHKI